MNLTYFLSKYSEIILNDKNNQPISHDILQNVQYVVKELSINISTEADIDIATIDGSVGVFLENEDVYIYIDFIPNDKIHYYYQLGNKPCQEDVIDSCDIGILCNQINCDFIE